MKLQCTLRRGKDDSLIANMSMIPDGDKAHVIRQALAIYFKWLDKGIPLAHTNLQQQQETQLETNVLESLSDF